MKKLGKTRSTAAGQQSPTDQGSCDVQLLLHQSEGLDLSKVDQDNP